MIITEFDKLDSEAQTIQSYCEITPSDNPQEITERIIELGVCISRTGKMLADAKYHLNKKRNEETMCLIERLLSKEKLSAKVQNSLLDSICRDEQYLVDSIERLNRTCVHQQDAMRSILSYERENLRISKTGY
ncbi:MAG: hypothetical protein LBT24_05905 [Tannerella sp.]|jgi:hypothetical protein|nr:hypothetical protein [Tannerella sp.]